MNIVLIRHAQKGMVPFDDPALSPVGFRQAEVLSSLVQDNKLPIPTEMWVSGKIRTRQTLQNIANVVRRPVVEKVELDLRHEDETQKMFNSRVGEMIDLISESSKADAISECIYLCTHYDWIEEAMTLIPSDTDLTSYQFAHWGPAQFAIFEVKAGLWKFIHKGSPRNEGLIMSRQLTQNIWAVGRNYADHAKEMNAPIPKTPMFFLKSGGCLNSGTKIELPKWSNNIHHEIEIALLVDDKLNFSHITLALDLTARDAQDTAKKAGQPWTLAKSFTGSCPVGNWISILDAGPVQLLRFDLKKNQTIVQAGNASDMIFNPSQLLEFVKNHYPISPNDIILTGTPEGVGPLASGDLLQAELRSEKQSLLTCHWDVI